jgi:hypothetical protein
MLPDDGQEPKRVGANPRVFLERFKHTIDFNSLDFVFCVH